LAEAGALLTESLDYRQTLQNLAHLATSFLTDWCAIFLEREGEIQRIASVHRVPQKNDLLPKLAPTKVFRESRAGVAAVIRTGRSEFYPQVDDAFLKEIAGTPERLVVFRELGLRSTIVVPLVAR